jgi:hypothetical protein
LGHNIPIIANAIIATKGLRNSSDYRMLHAMDTYAAKLIRTLGGTTAVSRMTEAPVSTVHSWKTNGIPPARLAHIKLAANAEGIRINWESGEIAACPACDARPDSPQSRACSRSDCGLRQKEAA